MSYWNANVFHKRKQMTYILKLCLWSTHSVPLLRTPCIYYKYSKYFKAGEICRKCFEKILYLANLAITNKKYLFAIALSVDSVFFSHNFYLFFLFFTTTKRLNSMEKNCCIFIYCFELFARVAHEFVVKSRFKKNSYIKRKVNSKDYEVIIKKQTNKK